MSRISRAMALWLRLNGCLLYTSIKVVTGVRRCGKSKLLELYQEWLLAQGVEEDQIISINFEDLDFEALTDYRELHAYLKARLAKGKMTYIFLDEIQDVYKRQLFAMLEVEHTERASCCLLVDKEEIGSVGATGMHSRAFENTVAELIALNEGESELKTRRAMANSRMLSSDVSAAYDPSFADAFETVSYTHLFI